MPSPDFLLATHVRLARISHERGQMLPRNKFLILAGAAACEAGLIRVANRCRDCVLKNNPNHLLKHSDSFADALRDSDFQFYLKQLVKFCSPERAELLLEGIGESSELLSEDQAIQILDGMMT